MVIQALLLYRCLIAVFGVCLASCHKIEYMEAALSPAEAMRQAKILKGASAASEMLAEAGEDTKTKVDPKDRQRHMAANERASSNQQRRLSVSGPEKLSMAIPSCGVTICDNPDLTQAYASSYTAKTLHYKVVNVVKDDGTRPLVTKEQIDHQQAYLNKGFAGTGITWELTEVHLKNSFVRERSVIVGCNPEKVGDGKCDSTCQHSKTGNDGGDCDTEKFTCAATKKGDGVCDPECNQAYNDFDGGDCCVEGTDTHFFCFDPKSSQRAYLSDTEYKVLLGITNDQHLTVHFAFWTTTGLLGFATFPWDATVYGMLGGTMMNPNNYGTENNSATLVHEFGHNLGLWHVHRGPSEEDCGGPCFEKPGIPSATTGDLCSDTPPTPKDYECRQSSREECGISDWPHAPYTNYMSYSPDGCLSVWSEQQIGRMHCYLDLKYKGWLEPVSQAPSQVPFAPTVLSSSASAGSMTMSWSPPVRLALGTSSAGADCDMCGPNSVFEQHATSATSSHPEDEGWESANTVGPPNSPTCGEMAAGAIHFPSSDDGGTTTFGLAAAVIPHTLTLHIAYGVDWEPERLVITAIYEGGGEVQLYDNNVLETDCEFELDVSAIAFSGPINAIKVQQFKRFVGIDALALLSRESSPACAGCPSTQYEVTRSPAWSSTSTKTVSSLQFTDSEMSQGISYQYSVALVGKHGTGVASPSLTFQLGQGYCGDGAVDSGETCDDGNLDEGDGCSSSCVTEPEYNCKVTTGTQSQCYKHCGDGICEAFEKKEGTCCISDCGFCAPDGATDQWASCVEGKQPRSSNTDKSLDAGICGAPKISNFDKKGMACEMDIDLFAPDFPDYEGICTVETDLDVPVLARSVFLYFVYGEDNPFTVEVRDATGKYHKVLSKTSLNCVDSPYEIQISYDMANIFVTAGLRITMYSQFSYLDAASVRSWDALQGKQCGNTAVWNGTNCIAVAVPESGSGVVCDVPTSVDTTPSPTPPTTQPCPVNQYRKDKEGACFAVPDSGCPINQYRSEVGGICKTFERCTFAPTPSPETVVPSTDPTPSPQPTPQEPVEGPIPSPEPTPQAPSPQPTLQEPVEGPTPSPEPTPQAPSPQPTLQEPVEGPTPSPEPTPQAPSPQPTPQEQGAGPAPSPEPTPQAPSPVASPQAPTANTSNGCTTGAITFATAVGLLMLSP
eukprot:TRINITY_DN4432_c0_g1_i2.p1 TRINITY_DN4432_c0_g1~~TRINITY_DN4432_c0_g1_i2.p1  ORF type:complete len:1178 (-),score=175.05 TRINITY_DN4432_c0_g1_i2:185-3718(-)